VNLRNVTMTEKEKMLSGGLYTVNDELRRGLVNARKIMRQYNATTEDEAEIRKKLLSELFAKMGKNIYIEPPFRCDYGSNISIGENFYANYDCIILDVNRVTIGGNVKFGPRVCVYTAGHPIDAGVRRSLLEFGKPVTIGGDVWVGGNAVINPGVSIGSNVVIGSGSVVTKNIPSNVVAAGNPCRVLRSITDEDRKYWEREKDKWVLTGVVGNSKLGIYDGQEKDKNMLPSVINAELRGGYEVYVEFDDGTKGIIDFKDKLENDHRQIIRDLLDEKLFRTVKINLHTLCWDNEVDFAPEYLYELIKNPGTSPDVI